MFTIAVHWFQRSRSSAVACAWHRLQFYRDIGSPLQFLQTQVVRTEVKTLGVIDDPE